MHDGGSMQWRQLKYLTLHSADPWGRLACVQVASDGFTSPVWGETGGRRGETGTEREKQRVRRKRPERSVKPQGEAWGTGEHNDVISIDSQGEHIFTVLYSCYHWTDRKEVGGVFTLNINSIRHNASCSALSIISSQKSKFKIKKKALNLSLHVLLYETLELLVA